MTAPRPNARLIDLTRPDWQPLPAADGLITLVPDTCARTAWADQILTQHHHGFVLWTASGGQPHAVLPQVSRRPGVRGLALAPAGDNPIHLQAALHLAYRLTRETTRPDEPVQVRVVSAVMPDTAEGLVRVPHLVTLRPNTGATTDTALWELLTADAAQRWFATREADLAHIEANLARLLALRTSSRTGHIPHDLPPRLAALLRQQPAPMSIETVCQHLDLILHQLTRHHGGPA